MARYATTSKFSGSHPAAISSSAFSIANSFIARLHTFGAREREVWRASEELRRIAPNCAELRARIARLHTFCTFSSGAASCSRSPSVASRSVNFSSGRSSNRSSADNASQWRSRIPGLRSACTTGTLPLNPAISPFSAFAMFRQPGVSLKLLISFATPRCAPTNDFSTSSGCRSSSGPSSHSRCHFCQSAAVVQSDAYGSKSLTSLASCSYSVAGSPKSASRVLKICAFAS